MNALDCGAADPERRSLRRPLGDENVAGKEPVLADDHFEGVAKEVHFVLLQQEVLPQQKPLEEKLRRRGEIGVRDEEIGG